MLGVVQSPSQPGGHHAPYPQCPAAHQGQHYRIPSPTPPLLPLPGPPDLLPPTTPHPRRHRTPLPPTRPRRQQTHRRTAPYRQVPLLRIRLLRRPTTTPPGLLPTPPSRRPRTLPRRRRRRPRCPLDGAASRLLPRRLQLLHARHRRAAPGVRLPCRAGRRLRLPHGTPIGPVRRVSRLP